MNRNATGRVVALAHFIGYEHWQLTLTAYAVVILAMTCVTTGAHAAQLQQQPPAEDYPAGIQWVFTQAGDHPDAVMVDGINSATTQVDAALYAVNRPTIVQALIDAQGRCQCVRLISDRTQAGGKAQKAALLAIQQAGVPVKIDRHTGIMHMKVIEVDGVTVFEGSFNATNAASTINDEILVRLDSADAATGFAAEYDAMWNDPNRFRDWVDTTPAEKPAADAF